MRLSSCPRNAITENIDFDTWDLAHGTEHYIDRRLSVAPMMDWTDRHFRYLVRLISRHTRLCTEMLHSNALLRGERDRLPAYHPSEHPLALQLGGSDPEMLGICSQIAEDYGYDEVNLNIGCPSERVQQGRFGACLLAEPQLVAHCVDTMGMRTALPVTVNTRLGIRRPGLLRNALPFHRTGLGGADGPQHFATP